MTLRSLACGAKSGGHIVFNVPVPKASGVRSQVERAPPSDPVPPLPGQVSAPHLPGAESKPMLKEGFAKGPASKSGTSLASGEAFASLPDEAVVLQVSGPFGAPAQKVWGFETLMVVGAGIGVPR